MKHGKPKPRGAQWQAKAKALAREHGFDVARVLDLHDELASLYEYGGDKRDAAELRAWNDTVEILAPRAA